MLITTLLLEHFIVFACLSVFRQLFYCVLIPVRLPSIPRRTPLFTTLLVPSLLLGYRPTEATTGKRLWDPEVSPIGGSDAGIRIGGDGNLHIQDTEHSVIVY